MSGQMVQEMVPSPKFKGVAKGQHSLPQRRSRAGRRQCRLECPTAQFPDPVHRKGHHHDHRQDTGQPPFAVPVGMGEVAALLLQGREDIVLDGPARPAGLHQSLQIVLGDPVIGSPSEPPGEGLLDPHLAATLADCPRRNDLLQVQHIDHEVGIAGIQLDTVPPAEGEYPAILLFDHPAPSTVGELGMDGLVALVLRSDDEVHAEFPQHPDLRCPAVEGIHQDGQDKMRMFPLDMWEKTLDGIRLAIVLGRPIGPGDQLRHQRKDPVVAGVHQTGGNHLVMMPDPTATPAAYRTVGTADPVGGVIPGTVDGQEMAPVSPPEPGQPAPTLEMGGQGPGHRPQGLRIDKVETFPHGRVARYAVDAEQCPGVVFQLRVDPVPAGIRVKVKERGVFQLEHRQRRQQAVRECQPAPGNRILKAVETCADRFHNPGCTQVAAQPPGLF